jgi:intein/homing endonuclease
MMIITLKGDNLKSGRTLVDTGSHLSLVRIGSLVRTHDIKERDLILERVTGNELPVIGSIVTPVYHESLEYKHNFKDSP